MSTIYRWSFIYVWRHLQAATKLKLENCLPEWLRCLLLTLSSDLSNQYLNNSKYVDKTKGSVAVVCAVKEVRSGKPFENHCFTRNTELQSETGILLSYRNMLSRKGALTLFYISARNALTLASKSPDRS